MNVLNVSSNAISMDSVGNLFFIQNSYVYSVKSGGVLSVFQMIANNIDFFVLDPQKKIYYVNGSSVISGNNSIVSGLSNPRGMAFDAFGHLYIAEITCNCIKKVVNGSVTNIYGDFNSPFDVAVDSRGNIFVADTANNVIKKIDIFGNVIVIARGFIWPTSVAVDIFDNVYVADYGNNAIKIINSIGLITVIKSAGGNPFNIVVDSLGTSIFYSTNSTQRNIVNCAGLTVGKTCSSYGFCSGGLACVSGVCKQQLSAGGDCTFRNAAICAPGLSCVDSKCNNRFTILGII